MKLFVLLLLNIILLNSFQFCYYENENKYVLSSSSCTGELLNDGEGKNGWYYYRDYYISIDLTNYTKEEITFEFISYPSYVYIRTEDNNKKLKKLNMNVKDNAYYYLYNQSELEINETTTSQNSYIYISGNIKYNTNYNGKALYVNYYYDTINNAKLTFGSDIKNIEIIGIYRQNKDISFDNYVYYNGCIDFGYENTEFSLSCTSRYYNQTKIENENKYKVCTILSYWYCENSENGKIEYKGTIPSEGCKQTTFCSTGLNDFIYLVSENKNYEIVSTQSTNIYLYYRTNLEKQISVNINGEVILETIQQYVPYKVKFTIEKANAITYISYLNTILEIENNYGSSFVLKRNFTSYAEDKMQLVLNGKYKTSIKYIDETLYPSSPYISITNLKETKYSSIEVYLKDKKNISVDDKYISVVKEIGSKGDYKKYFVGGNPFYVDENNEVVERESESTEITNGIEYVDSGILFTEEFEKEKVKVSFSYYPISSYGINSYYPKEIECYGCKISMSDSRTFRTKPIKITTYSQFQFVPSTTYFESNSFLFENPTENTFSINIQYDSSRYCPFHFNGKYKISITSISGISSCEMIGTVSNDITESDITLPSTDYVISIYKDIIYENRNLLYVCPVNYDVTKFNYKCSVSSKSFLGTNIYLPTVTPKECYLFSSESVLTTSSYETTSNVFNSYQLLKWKEIIVSGSSFTTFDSILDLEKYNEIIEVDKITVNNYGFNMKERIKINTLNVSSTFNQIIIIFEKQSTVEETKVLNTNEIVISGKINIAAIPNSMKLIYSNITLGFKRYIMNVDDEYSYMNNQCNTIGTNVIDFITEYKQIDCTYLMNSGLMKLMVDDSINSEELIINKDVSLDSIETYTYINKIIVNVENEDEYDTYYNHIINLGYVVINNRNMEIISNNIIDHFRVIGKGNTINVNNKQETYIIVNTKESNTIKNLNEEYGIEIESDTEIKVVKYGECNKLAIGNGKTTCTENNDKNIETIKETFGTL